MQAGKNTSLTIHYTTTKDAEAFNWLEPSQTSGGKKPYMFTQCEPIHCRSIAPMQDTPAIKQTYSAKIRAPQDHNVLMSANKTDDIK